MTAHTFDAEKGIVFGARGQPVGRTSRQGYVWIEDGRGYVGSAHRMIWESVHGPIPSGLQINHINGIKSDNRIANLELVTPSENGLHAYRTGLSRADGTNNGRYKHGRCVGAFQRRAKA